jgi:hypothetical protein
MAELSVPVNVADGHAFSVAQSGVMSKLMLVLALLSASCATGYLRDVYFYRPDVEVHIERQSLPGQ